jgi:hypothetical protein
LETLRPTGAGEQATAAGQGVQGVSIDRCGIYVAMDGLINYLKPEYGVTFAMGKSFLFSWPACLMCELLLINPLN